MLVPISIKIGEEAIAILPGVHKQFGIDHVKAVQGKITKIKKLSNGETSVTIDYKDYTVIAPNYPAKGASGSFVKKVVKVFDWRIAKYTFGGVFQPNDQFDLDRIEKEEGIKLDPAFLTWL